MNSIDREARLSLVSIVALKPFAIRVPGGLSDGRGWSAVQPCGSPSRWNVRRPLLPRRNGSRPLSWRDGSPAPWSGTSEVPLPPTPPPDGTCATEKGTRDGSGDGPALSDPLATTVPPA